MPTEFRTTPCKGCGKPMVMARQSDGKWIPLDPKPAVYRVVERADGGAWCERDTDCMVTHYATCPHASKFSKRKKKPDS